MSTDRRRDLIRQLEERRGSRVITYVTGDRTPAIGQMGDDAVRPIFDHLRAIGQVDKLDIFLYSRGGAIDVPWRLAPERSAPGGSGAGLGFITTM